MFLQLPPDPNLEQLNNQAKELVKAHKAQALISGSNSSLMIIT